MARNRKEILEEEVRQLRKLKALINAEKESLIGMDRKKLIETAREKEDVALRLKQLNIERQDFDKREGRLPIQIEEKDLYDIREKLLIDVRDRNQIQQEVIETQKEQVEYLLAFIKHFHGQSAVYDRRGRLR